MDAFVVFLRTICVIFSILRASCLELEQWEDGQNATFKDFITGHNVSCANAIFNSSDVNECWLSSYSFKTNKTAEKCNYTFPSVNNYRSNDISSNLLNMQLEFYKRILFVDTDMSIPVIGLNITTILSSPMTQGFVFRVSSDESSVNEIRCFVLDIHKSPKPWKSTSLWIDVIGFIPNNSYFRLEITEYPSQMTRQFLSRHFSSSYNMNPTTLNQWQPLIFIEENLPDNSIAVMFKSAPERFGLINYTVRLISDTAANNRVRPIFTTEFQKFNRVVFKDLNKAVYNIAVECAQCTTGMIQVNFLTDAKENVITESAIIAISMAVFLVITCIVVLLACKPWRCLYRTKLSAEDNSPQVVILYSYDSDAHSALIGAFVSALERDGVKVLYDQYRKEIAPSKWLSNSVTSANYVIIVWSEGAILKWEDQNDRLELNEPGNLTSPIFSRGANWAMNKHIKGSRSTIANVCWQRKSFKKKIPNEFKGCKKFTVPKDWFKLLRFLRGEVDCIDSINALWVDRDPLKAMGEKFENTMMVPSAYILSKEEPRNMCYHELEQGNGQMQFGEVQQVDSENLSMPSNTMESFLSDVSVIPDNADQERLQAVKDLLQDNLQDYRLQDPDPIPQLPFEDQISNGEEFSREESLKAILQGDVGSLDCSNYNEYQSPFVVTDYRPSIQSMQQESLGGNPFFSPGSNIGGSACDT